MVLGTLVVPWLSIVLLNKNIEVGHPFVKKGKVFKLWNKDVRGVPAYGGQL